MTSLPKKCVQARSRWLSQYWASHEENEENFESWGNNLPDVFVKLKQLFTNALQIAIFRILNYVGKEMFEL